MPGKCPWRKVQVVGETRQTSRPRSNLQSVSIRLISEIRSAMNQAVRNNQSAVSGEKVPKIWSLMASVATQGFRESMPVNPRKCIPRDHKLSSASHLVGCKPIAPVGDCPMYLILPLSAIGVLPLWDEATPGLR